MAQYITSGKHIFEIVKSVPAGYEIWGIGKNMVDGYLPLCKLKEEQPYEGGRLVDPDTLKAIKLEGAQTVLAAIYFGPHTVKGFERYIKRYNGSKSAYVQRRVARAKAALEIMRTIKWD